MNHTNRTHLPGQARFVCQTDIFVVGSDMTGSPVMQRPWLVATIDAYSRAILELQGNPSFRHQPEEIHGVTTP